MPNLDDISWAAITFKRQFLTYDFAYLAVLGNNAFLEKLRYHPKDLDVNEVRSLLVWFLNKWGCRLRDNNIITSNLKNCIIVKNCIIEIYPELSAVQKYSIFDFNFEDAITKEKIENIFKKFWDYGSQITKILSLLQQARHPISSILIF